MKDFCSKSENLERISDVDFFFGGNGMKMTHLSTQGMAQGELAVGQESLNPGGMVHGGCLTTLADTVCGWAVCSATRHNCVTVNCTMQFLRPAKGTNEKIYCKATPQKIGKTMATYDALLTDDAGVVVSTGVFTFYILEPLTEATLDFLPK